jgi:hypothetical protein
VFPFGNLSETYSSYNIASDISTFESSSYYTNLKNFVLAAAETGFVEFEIQIGPAGGSDNDPHLWFQLSNCTYTDGLCQPYFDQNWNFMLVVTQAVSSVLEANGYGSTVTVKYDLFNEQVPTSTSGIMADYLYQMWINWMGTYSNTNTVGESYPGDSSIIDAVDGSLAVYASTGYDPPSRLDVHIYGDATYLTEFDSELHNKGYTGSIVIGEALYNDESEASSIRTAISDGLYHTVDFLLQWPLTRSDWGSEDVDVAVPSSYSWWNYYGF